MKHLIRLVPIAAVCLWSCSPSGQTDSELAADYPQAFTITIANTTSLQRTDAIVTIPLADITATRPEFNAQAFVAIDGARELPSQAIDRDGDGEAEEIAILIDIAPGASQELAIRFARSDSKQRDYPQRAQAELSHKFGGEWQDGKYVGGDFQNVMASGVRNWHTDHTEFFRYEGPGWESDKVGYRFYLDWRNAIDIFGKKTPDMVLQNVGLDGYDSYHEMADWGMDILKVGASLGIGSIGVWLDGKAQRIDRTDSVWCEIIASGPIYAQIRTTYLGWQAGAHKADLRSELSIAAGSRMTHHAIEITGALPNLCTGIAKEAGVDYFSSGSDASGDWRYLAHYGKQSLAGDHVGLAVLYRQSDAVEVTEDNLNHVVVLRPASGRLEYYFLAAWEQEPGGITSKQQFITYLDEIMTGLNSPLVVSF